MLDDAEDIVIIATLAKEEAPEEGATVVPGAEVAAATPAISVERGKKEEEAPAKK